MSGLFQWMVELIVAVVVAVSSCAGAPVPETEIGSALSCEVVSETEIECREVFEDGTVVVWREARR